MKNIAWGYVSRDLGRGKEILVAKRYKQGDELRKGELVLPGGGLDGSETYLDAAIREVREETGIKTVNGKPRRLSPGEREFSVRTFYGTIMPSGLIHGRYTDSGKEYEGMLYLLDPETAGQEPEEQPESDAKEPQYMKLAEALRRKGEFTPACELLLDLIREFERL